ncbi:MAG: hypothetical protein AB7P17_02170 [Nitrospirales bacterium]|nr:hypothetical protein [Nitrospirales bacterium]
MPGGLFSHTCARFLVSLLLPCSGLFLRHYYRLGAQTLLLGIGITAFTALVTNLAGIGAGVFSGILLLFPWWMFQAFQSSLAQPGSLARTLRLIWTHAHDIRLIGLMFGMAAFTDIWIIIQNPDYQLNVFCSRPTGMLGILSKVQSPLFHLAIGYGFFRLLQWSLFVYLTYAGYGLLNATVNWACEGYGRIRTVFIVSLLIFTVYILIRRNRFGTASS